MKSSLAWSTLLGMMSLSACNVESTDSYGYEDTAFGDSEGPGLEDSLDTGVAPSYWSIEADLKISNEALVVEESLISVTWWDNNAQLVCSQSLFLPSSSFVTAPEPNIWGWWHLQLSETDDLVDSEDSNDTSDTLDSGAADSGDTEITDPEDSDSEIISCELSFPSELYLGLGLFDDQLTAAADMAGEDPALRYGSYIQWNDEDLYVFGVGEAVDGNDDTVTPVTEAPLPDGRYLVRTLYLLPWSIE